MIKIYYFSAFQRSQEPDTSEDTWSSFEEEEVTDYTSMGATFHSNQEVETTSSTMASLAAFVTTDTSSFTHTIAATAARCLGCSCSMHCSV